MKAFTGGKIVLENSVQEGKALLFDEKIIGVCEMSEIPSDAETIDASDKLILPGLIDVHTHGCVGEDSSDGSLEGMHKMATELVKTGVTAFCPTTMTLPYDVIEAAFEVARAEQKHFDGKSAYVLGVNCEGPFISYARKGAQAGEHIKNPDVALMERHRDILRLVTVAPEVDGSLDFIRKTTEMGIRVSIGHSDCDYECAMAAIEAGVTHFTHLFNAMTLFDYRKGSPVVAALSSDAFCEIIGDTFHVHPGLYPFLSKAKGDRMVLITDSMRAAGVPEGEYSLCCQAVIVEGGMWRLRCGTIAGSVLRLNEALRNVRSNTSLPLYTVVAMATLNPAKSIGADNERGSIEAGKRADLVVCDDDFNVISTYIGGEKVY